MGSVQIDDEGVREAGGEGVRWDDLVEVVIVTTDEGPWIEDAFWLLTAHDGGSCEVPNAHAAPLVQRMARVPGASLDAVIEAMASTEDARFPVWKGERGGARAAGHKDEGTPAV